MSWPLILHQAAQHSTYGEDCIQHEYFLPLGKSHDTGGYLHISVMYELKHGTLVPVIIMSDKITLILTKTCQFKHAS